MRHEFAVLYEQRPVGKAEVVKDGLYYRVTCRYRLPSAEVCRVIIKWTAGWENIGIPVPEGDGFILSKKIPIKKLPVPDMTIHLIPVGIHPDAIERTDDTADAEVTEDPGVAPENSNDETTAVETIEPKILPVFEDQSFDELDLVEEARSVTVDGQIYIALEECSDLKLEPHGAVVGAEDIGIDGGFEDGLSEPV